MKHKLSIVFGPGAIGKVTADINNLVVYSGNIQNIDIEIELQNHNSLTLLFDEIDYRNSVEIIEIFYNNLSIEHFIFQGVFTDANGKISCPATTIVDSGHWNYTFSCNLAREIIKANT